MKCVFAAVTLALAGTAAAQTTGASRDASPPPAPALDAETAVADVPPSVDFAQYLQLVQKNNLAVAAQKAQIDIADAQIALAALFPDPYITTGLAAYELTRDKLPTISTLGVNFTIEGGKKREVRTEAARADKARAEAEFARQMVSVQLEAANAYIDQLRARELQQHWQASLALLQRLEQQGQKRREKPDVVSDVQLRAEMLRARAELDAASADVYIFSRAMLAFAQPQAGDFGRPLDGKGSLSLAVLEGYETKARQGMREDVVVAQKALDAARKREELSRENRSLDLNFNVGINHARAGDYLGTTLPQSNSLMATVAIPLPFSLRQDGDLRAASAAATQALKQYQDLSLRAGLEAEQVRARYGASVSQMQKYRVSAEMTASALQSQANLYFANKAELGDVILLLKLANDAQALSTESRANHARSMAALLSRVRELHTMQF